jgi:hypothetical protein
MIGYGIGCVREAKSGYRKHSQKELGADRRA